MILTLLVSFGRRFEGREMRISNLTRKLETFAHKLPSFFIVFHGIRATVRG